jgi:hypothetical protein
VSEKIKWKFCWKHENQIDGKTSYIFDLFSGYVKIVCFGGKWENCNNILHIMKNLPI